MANTGTIHYRDHQLVSGGCRCDFRTHHAAWRQNLPEVRPAGASPGQVRLYGQVAHTPGPAQPTVAEIHHLLTPYTYVRTLALTLHPYNSRDVFRELCVNHQIYLVQFSQINVQFVKATYLHMIL